MLEASMALLHHDFSLVGVCRSRTNSRYLEDIISLWCLFLMSHNPSTCTAAD